MADKLYAFTRISHGYIGKDGKHTQVVFEYGDEFNSNGFTEADIANLIEAGALTRVNLLAEEPTAPTVEEAAAIAAPEEKK